MSSFKGIQLGTAAGAFAVLLLVVARAPAQAQVQKIVPCPAQQLNLIPVPEIKSNPLTHKLKATLRLTDGMRTMWGATDDPRCATQHVRYFAGSGSGYSPAWPTGPEPIPGPTFRARLGDLVEITFFNQININNFASTLDHGAVGSQEACDQFTQGGSPQSPPQGDTMPNCLHGSSTTNVHFHGTHTSPSTTGDNVLLFIRPSLGTKPNLQPTEAQTATALTPFWSSCEAHYQTAALPAWPTLWTQMPVAWQNLQKSLLQQYDATAPYQGHNGNLPLKSQLWPANFDKISHGYWPQYHLGAVPFCFPLPAYNPAKLRMGQAPGTHWYHAHKHGSTALNVANGMTGAFIIEGKYDDDLQHYYGAGLRQQVLVLQQMGTAPFPLTNPKTTGPGSVGKPPISVNGRLDPVVAMKPGEVQMWRIVNGAFRDAVQFAYFKPQPPNVTGIVPPPKPQCSPAPAAPAPIRWRQIAQDGVQFAVQNYHGFGAIDNRFNLAPANRADILVQAPTHAGRYTLCIVTNNGLLLDNGPSNAASPGAAPLPPSVLLTVAVGGTPLSPPMQFVPDAQFPTQPSFLTDIRSSEIVKHRTLTFGAAHNQIDGQSFQDGVINQQMTLNTAEEWIVKNDANDKSHPFHIHINPFQILELFEPNKPNALNKLNSNGQPNPCYVDPQNPDTWDPARPTYKDTCPSRVLPGPWVWWDTFAIPTSHTIPLDASFCQTTAACLAKLGQQYSKIVACSGSPGACTVQVDGWFRMRSRFVDYTGQYVLHCHILIHEDRGMMQLIEVLAGKPTTNKSVYTHH